ncbi:MAG: LysM peptidoglycan-binding domain-containing protein [Pyrinomonadaceae bacterium]
MKNIKYLGALLLTAATFGSTVAFAASPVPDPHLPSQTYTVPQGTVIRVRMNSNISSKTARVGDTFSTTVTEPVYSSSGVVVIPTGSTLTGRVNAVRTADKGGKPGEIDADFIEVRLPNGARRSISGSLTDLDAGKTSTDNEGTASGDKMKNRKIIFIGGGAAGGAILGAIVGGGKATAIGAIVGAGAGLLGERLLKGPDAEVKSGTEFNVFINRAFSLPRFSEARTETPVRDDPGTGSGRTYVVRPGDTLGKISFRFYGTTRRYMDIYEANRDVLSSPSSIAVGQELRIP